MSDESFMDIAGQMVARVRTYHESGDEEVHWALKWKGAARALGIAARDNPELKRLHRRVAAIAASRGEAGEAAQSFDEMTAAERAIAEEVLALMKAMFRRLMPDDLLDYLKSGQPIPPPDPAIAARLSGALQRIMSEPAPESRIAGLPGARLQRLAMRVLRRRAREDLTWTMSDLHYEYIEALAAGDRIRATTMRFRAILGVPCFAIKLLPRSIAAWIIRRFLQP